jgi:uncharacterized membrane protein
MSLITVISVIIAVISVYVIADYKINEKIAQSMIFIGGMTIVSGIFIGGILDTIIKTRFNPSSFFELIYINL